MYFILKNRNERICININIMKKVIINGAFTTDHINGIPRYATEIVKRLDLRFEKGQLELVVPKNAINIPELKNIVIVVIGRKDTKIHSLLWDNIYFRKYVIKNNAGCVDFSNNAEYVYNSLTALHDIIPIYNSAYDVVWINSSLLRILKKIFFCIRVLIKKQTAKYIITVSKFSQKCISDRFSIEQNRIKIIGNGWEHINDIVPINENLNIELEHGNYFFTIGNILPYKNINWIILEAKIMPNETFVIAGKMSIQFVKKFNAELPNVIFLGYISDSYMKYLMQNCKALLFPSLIEGFGIPPLEALALNVPVIASDIPVMREIYGETIHYIDPIGDPIDLNSILKQQINGDKQKILQEHSWDKMADLWEKLIREVYYDE